MDENPEILARILRVKKFREMKLPVHVIAAIEKVHVNTIRNDLRFLKLGQKKQEAQEESEDGEEEFA